MEPTISTHAQGLIEDLANTSAHCGDGRGLVTEMVAADKALTAYIASLEADRAALEWLVANPNGLKNSASKWVTWEVGATGYGLGNTAREAISNWLNRNLHPLPQGTPTL